MSTERFNDVTLYSNGIGHFRRVYKVKAGAGPTAISIPFKRDHIGDVAASLQVFGEVKQASPPSFTPSNSNATALNIDSFNAMEGLLSSLSGAQVTIRLATTVLNNYTLLGIERREVTAANGGTTIQTSVVAQNDRGVSKYNLEHVSSVEFVEESVRTEIQKALKNNFQQIKPDSTLMELSLSPLKNDTDAVVQYTTPVAAWKMRYAVRQETKDNKSKFVLEGAAIIDNNTDEDWDNFRVSVVTGNPISFSTDIAQVCTPQRKFVSLVDNQVQGNVDVAEGMVMMACAAPNNRNARGLSKSMSGGLESKMGISNYASFGLEAADNDSGFYEGPIAEAPGVESREVGDFCVFTSLEPITILARKSAVVPMFTVPLTEAGVVLYYKESNNARRPYRTVKIRNETQYSLGKGKTLIYNNGVFSGECVLDTTKPGENRMLPHCLENGVKVSRTQKPIETRNSSIKISAGTSVTETVQSAFSEYVIDNKKGEAFKMALEYNTVLGNTNAMVAFDGVEVKEQEKLTNGQQGYRVYFELPANKTVKLTVTETSLVQHSLDIANVANWLQNYIIHPSSPLVNDTQIKKCVTIQSKIDDVQANISECSQRKNELETQAGRVRQNLEVAKSATDNTVVQRWVKDLDDTERDIRVIDKTTVPTLQSDLKQLRNELKTELRKISATWNESVKAKK